MWANDPNRALIKMFSLLFVLKIMMDLHQDKDEDDDSDRTESYTPPPLDITNTSNQSSEKENQYKQHTTVQKEQSIIVLDDSFNQVSISRQDDHEPSNEKNEYFTHRLNDLLFSLLSW